MYPLTVGHHISSSSSPTSELVPIASHPVEGYLPFMVQLDATQSLALSEPAGDPVPALQFKHPVCPVKLWYVFEAQFEQATLPVLALYFPATHAVHVPPSGPV
jgi:hypothetical protein